MSSRFEYVKYDDKRVQLQNEFKGLFKNLEEMINASFCNSREKNLSLTKLEECYMWIGKSIKVDQERGINGWEKDEKEEDCKEKINLL